MPKKALQVTLELDNVLWLSERAKLSGSNLSEELDRLITDARLGRMSPLPTVGMVDLGDDPDLLKAEEAIETMFDESMEKTSLQMDEEAPGDTGPAGKKKRR